MRGRRRHHRFASLPASLALLAGVTAIGAATSCASGTGTGGAAGASSSASTGGMGGTTRPPDACSGDGDCSGNPLGAICDVQTGLCVGCLPGDDPCVMGEACDPATHTCAPGCQADANCAGDPGDLLRCDLAAHACVACLGDGDCPAGQLCATGVHVCVPGCSPGHACGTGFTCCGASCHDLTSDLFACGACGQPCAPVPNASGACVGGMCQIGECLPAFADCDGDAADGCEQNKLEDGDCTCAPGATQSCYQGGPGTLGVGPCHAGTQTCEPSGTSWGPCLGQVLPVWEVCNNQIDDDCDGLVDDVPDQDGDGWTVCDGDCCDVPGPGCPDPRLVNPGAFEVAGDGIDNDCDGTVDNVAPTSCSGTIKLTGVTGTDVAHAMDLCQFTTASPPLPQKIWGVIAATQVHADGSAATVSEAQNSQTAIKTTFGTGGVTSRKNATMAVISTGMARAPSDTGWVLPINGTSFTSSIAFPGTGPLGTYTAAHGGGLLPGHCGATACSPGTGANDSIDIRLQIRTPTNAQGFSYDFRFFSAEYHTFQCTYFNDYYLALLTSLAPGIPADHNISFDALDNPVSVNNGFFQDCASNGKGCGTCPHGTAALAGTGFDQVNGGATEWLTTDAPIVPGETITIDLTLFDVQDHELDSLILLDNFRWSLTPVILGTHT